MAVPSTGGLVAGEHVAALLWLARQLLDWTTIYYLGGFAYPLLESVRAASAADARAARAWLRYWPLLGLLFVVDTVARAPLRVEHGVGGADEEEGRVKGLKQRVRRAHARDRLLLEVGVGLLLALPPAHAHAAEVAARRRGVGKRDVAVRVMAPDDLSVRLGLQVRVDAPNTVQPVGAWRVLIGVGEALVAGVAHGMSPTTDASYRLTALVLSAVGAGGGGCGVGLGRVT